MRGILHVKQTDENDPSRTENRVLHSEPLYTVPHSHCSFNTGIHIAHGPQLRSVTKKLEKSCFRDKGRSWRPDIQTNAHFPYLEPLFDGSTFCQGERENSSVAVDAPEALRLTVRVRKRAKWLW